MKKVLAILALTILTACDYAERKDRRQEREDSVYRAAMEDYRAGRIDAAVEGFEKVIRRDPANASARFQLACLQQDAKKRWMEAYCGYREYLLQEPESDKARLAKDRMAMCEKELAAELATKYGLNDSAALSKELGVVRKELKVAQQRIAAAEKNLGESQARVRQLVAERDRLVQIVKGGSAVNSDAATDSSVATRPSVKEVKDLLEEEDETSATAPSATEVVRLQKELDEEDLKTSDILVPRIAATNKPAVVRAPEPKKKPVAAPEHPPTYVVQEGDTLYSVAKRFYGKVSAWKFIRNANKTLISSDNRLRAGDTLVLP